MLHTLFMDCLITIIDNGADTLFMNADRLFMDVAPLFMQSLFIW